MSKSSKELLQIAEEVAQANPLKTEWTVAGVCLSILMSEHGGTLYIDSQPSAMTVNEFLPARQTDSFQMWTSATTKEVDPRWLDGEPHQLSLLVHGEAVGIGAGRFFVHPLGDKLFVTIQIENCPADLSTTAEDLVRDLSA